jgi:hypothetical protein
MVYLLHHPEYGYRAFEGSRSMHTPLKFAARFYKEHEAAERDRAPGEEIEQAEMGSLLIGERHSTAGVVAL